MVSPAKCWQSLVLISSLCVAWEAGAQQGFERCEMDSMTAAEAEARVEWARRCSLGMNVGNPGGGFYVTSSLIDYQESDPSTNYWGYNTYNGTMMNYEVNATYLYALFTNNFASSQSLDAQGYWKWNWPATGKRAFPLYPSYGNTAFPTDAGSVPLYPHPQLADCRLYTDRSGFNAVSSFYTNLYCVSTSAKLANGVAATSLSGAAGAARYYTVVVPEGSTTLTLSMAGGTGEANMYVRYGARPTTSVFSCAPGLTGNNETCTFTAPAAGTYYVMVYGLTSYSGVSLTARWNRLTRGTAVTNLFGGAASEKYYTFTAGVNTISAIFQTSGGAGNVDIYVSYGSPASPSSYWCASTGGTNSEYCEVDMGPGTYYVTLRGASAFSGVSLTATTWVEPPCGSGGRICP
jgi:serine protease